MCNWKDTISLLTTAGTAVHIPPARMKGPASVLLDLSCDEHYPDYDLERHKQAFLGATQGCSASAPPYYRKVRLLGTVLIQGSERKLL